MLSVGAHLTNCISIFGASWKFVISSPRLRVFCLNDTVALPMTTYAAAQCISDWLGRLALCVPRCQHTGAL